MNPIQLLRFLSHLFNINTGFSRLSLSNFGITSFTFYTIILAQSRKHCKTFNNSELTVDERT